MGDLTFFFFFFFLRSNNFFLWGPIFLFVGGLIFYLNFFFSLVQIFFGMEGDGGNNDRPGTDHVTSGAMRGLEKTAPMAHTDRSQTNRHGDSMTEFAQWGQFNENPPHTLCIMHCALCTVH